MATFDGCGLSPSGASARWTGALPESDHQAHPVQLAYQLQSAAQSLNLR